MTICVVENIREHHRAYVLALRQNYHGVDKVIPEQGKPCQTWEEAQKLIKRAPKSEELVLILDLALKDEGDAAKGIEQSHLFRLEYPSAILIALTSFATEVRQHSRSKEIFDAVIDKQTSVAKNPESLRELLHEKIEEARRRRTNTPDPGKPLIQVQDSLGMRLAEAAITPDGILELVEKETKGWTNITVRALTSGNSGSYLLQVCGQCAEQTARLVLKVALKCSVLENESKAVGDKGYGPMLNQFAGKIAAADGPHQLNDRDIYYCRQVSVAGDTLYELIRNGSKAKASQAFRALLQLLSNQYRDAASTKSRGDHTVEKCFAFRPDHPHRIYDSCARLLPAAKLLDEAKQWPDYLPSPEIVFASVEDITKRWPGLSAKIRVPYWVVQHGDLHADNVLVSGVQLSFIDLARLQTWPVGYDISRLATHARIHLPWHAKDQDWVMHDLTNWAKEEFATLERGSSREVCEWSGLADEAFRLFLEKRPAEEHESFRRLYQFCTLSDLLRIISYGTLSHFKRIWVAIAIWQLGRRLGFCRSL